MPVWKAWNWRLGRCLVPIRPAPDGSPGARPASISGLTGSLPASSPQAAQRHPGCRQAALPLLMCLASEATGEAQAASRSCPAARARPGGSGCGRYADRDEPRDEATSGGGGRAMEWSRPLQTRDRPTGDCLLMGMFRPDGQSARHRALRLARRRQDQSAESPPCQPRGPARGRDRQRHQRCEHRRGAAARPQAAQPTECEFSGDSATPRSCQPARPAWGRRWARCQRAARWG